MIKFTVSRRQSLFLSAMFLVLPLMCLGKVVYVNHETGDNSWLGVSGKARAPDGPVKTFSKALSLLRPGDTLSIMKTEKPYRERMRLKIKGTAEAPITIEGNGAIIDLGSDISDGPWKKEGDFWSVNVDRKAMKSQWAIAFYRGVPIVMSKSTPFAGYGAEDFLVKKGEDGALLIRFPDGMEPPFTGTYLPGAEKGVMLDNAKYVRIRNLNVRGASNDGFGLHGHCEGIVLENCSAILCGDEGASAHGKSEAEFRDCLFAWNGSSAGGVADVHETVTSYTRCISAFGRGTGFAFKGKKHRLIDSYALGNLRWENAKNSLPKDRVEVVNLVEIPDGPEAYAKARELAEDNPQMKLLVELAKEIHWPEQ
ncbi:right-handed parallel beta-helix repeat-containing protein [Rubellicoccus peritrichatus]|uniref:Right-handed parallel beta-helix repeat-containing protein n=1 Tax=Rubellicoccus peritrichatus TaxID=3080537 RepID=A0AAQ3LC44_9BACT|nr:right-handed parallel beta-helix repeat-containing protein [Puniceicoccus sp. CR14]WOO41692.1 right-handed parallel beta-helix repeat-containing protein [Puniceicoccus sp. CR14]